VVQKDNMLRDIAIEINYPCMHAGELATGTEEPS